MTIHEIEQAITELSPYELARFRQWFEKFWDGQFKRDARPGKLSVKYPVSEEHLRKLQGSLKGKGALKVLIGERCKW